MAHDLIPVAPPDHLVHAEQVAAAVAQACPSEPFRGKRVLLIVPDGTRTAPVGVLFKAIHGALGTTAAKLDVLVALGTHQPMNEASICQRLELSSEERRARYPRVEFFNHEWDNSAAL